MSTEILEDMLVTIHERGIKYLIPITDRIKHLAEQVDAGHVKLPTYQKGGRTLLATDEILAMCGTQNMTSVPIEVRDAIFDLGQKHGIESSRPRSLDQPRKLGSAVDDAELESVEGEQDLETEEPDQEAALTLGRVTGFLRPLDALWQLRHKIDHDQLRFDPFPGENGLTETARSNSRDSLKRTFTVPVLQGSYLIDAALRWVLDYSPSIMACVEELNDLAAGHHERGHWRPHAAAFEELSTKYTSVPEVAELHSPWPMHATYFRSSSPSDLLARPSLRQILFEYLATACIIVIAAFTARRHEEILSLRAGCVSGIEGEDWIECYIEKTIQDHETLPIPRAVVKAVEVLHWLSETRRRRTGEPWITAYDEAVRTRWNPVTAAEGSGSHNVYKTLERFAVFVGVPPLSDGSTWVPKPHQFRRFFGMVYYHRFRFPHLTALSYFYRHNDPDVTRRYVTEAASGSFVREQDLRRADDVRRSRTSAAIIQERFTDFRAEGEAFRRDRYLDVLNGDYEMTGFGGAALKAQLLAMVASMKIDLELVPEAELDKKDILVIATALASKTQLEPNGLGHTYCKCTQSPVDRAAAECLKQGAVVSGERSFGPPDPTYASDVTCAKCPHGVKFPENKAYFDGAIAVEQAASACAMSPLLAVLHERRLAELDSIRHRCFEGGADG